ncbi:MAG TPA: ABC transporter permease [Candidatus Sulfotelmatobacter sp.]|nr:ABC transporter permease [Candidatus Sulfotelmatobacter sp.]
MQAIGIAGGRTSMQAGGNKAGTSIRLTGDDIDRLVTNVPQLTRITQESFYEAPVSYEGRSCTWNVSGSNPPIQEIQNLQIDAGRFYSAEDAQLRARVCVLGSESKEKLFSGRFALGERIRINGIPYDVVGVLKPRPQEGSENSINRVVYIPFATHERLPRYALYRHDLARLSRLRLSRGREIDSEYASSAAQFPPDDDRALRVFSLMEQLSQFHIISMALQVLLAFMGTLTLGIGGVGS